MKNSWVRAFSLVAGVFILQSAIAADTNPPPRLTVELRDGSRVVGDSVAERIEFHSTLLGELKLKVKDIRTVDCAVSNRAALVTANGDALSVSFPNVNLALKTSFGRVELAMDSIRKISVAATDSSKQDQLINIDFGSGGDRGWSLKKGPAAIGTLTTDFWNFYDRDASTRSGDWRRSGWITDLKLANGEPSTVDLNVANAPGAWDCDSEDPMYKTYVYPLDGRENIVSLQQLPEGEYNFLVYSPDGNCELAVGGKLNGAKRNFDDSKGRANEWMEGTQYVRWSNVPVAAGQAVTFTIRRGAGNYAILSGMQIQSAALAQSKTP